MSQKKKKQTGAAKATIRERVKQAAGSLKERQRTMNEETQVQQEGMAPDQPQTPEQAEKAVPDGEEIQESAQAETAALEKELEETRAQRDEYLDLVQRKQAEFANYRRRTESVRQEAYDDGRRDAIEKLLPVVDNLERALDAAGEESAAIAVLQTSIDHNNDSLRRLEQELTNADARRENLQGQIDAQLAHIADIDSSAA